MKEKEKEKNEFQVVVEKLWRLCIFLGRSGDARGRMAVLPSSCQFLGRSSSSEPNRTSRI